ncbi:MAG: gfo/Idh/MocA family oxidoreductase, partial [Armatimonadota bacterium]
MSMTRRQFLHRTTSAAAAPLILSAGARGANDRIALGVIGTGKRGTGVMRTFLGLDGVEVVAVCDVQKDRRESAAALVDKSRGDATQNGCKAYSDFREILARD